MQNENHYIHRNNWLRAAVLGANDGIISTTSLVIGVAAAGSSRQVILLAALASLVAGAGSMAAGEYVSVCSQTDLEKADLEREKNELEATPKEELEELADIYVKRGLDKQLARQVATQLMTHNALDAHAKDELGINEMTTPRPLQAAMASAASFLIGGLLPLLFTIIISIEKMVVSQYLSAIVSLAILGGIAAKIGGSNIKKSAMRICFWGTVAMLSSALVGSIFGMNS
ncbi:VIT family protein [Parabacteroides sp. Marseille-P3160]|uniref:VIT1/CCC1 transporter family protein n=1 Tax=Parabacteroides sp. Marseille-P3160 TaxID=1917887 RepID=UPI0009BB2FF3|nr:VIT family protein [Parabacteroides sp. Marseille-P3160]